MARTPLDFLLQPGLTLFIWLGFNFISLLDRSCINLMFPCTKRSLTQSEEVSLSCTFLSCPASLPEFLPSRVTPYPDAYSDSCPRLCLIPYPSRYPEPNPSRYLSRTRAFSPELCPSRYLSHTRACYLECSHENWMAHVEQSKDLSHKAKLIAFLSQTK
jgi:hypothetical protein